MAGSRAGGLRATSTLTTASAPPGQSAQGTSRRGFSIPISATRPPSIASARGDPEPDPERVHRGVDERGVHLVALGGRHPAHLRHERPRAVAGDDAGGLRAQVLAGHVVCEAIGEGARDDRAERGDREQPGNPGDGVVDAARHPRVPRRDRTQHGRGQRRDRRRQPQREHEHAREDLADVVGACVGPHEQQQSAHRPRSARRP